jgi:hypothetical protein
MNRDLPQETTLQMAKQGETKSHSDSTRDSEGNWTSHGLVGVLREALN